MKTAFIRFTSHHSKQNSTLKIYQKTIPIFLCSHAVKMPLPFSQFLPHLQNYQKIFTSFRENSTISDSQRNYSSFLICLTVFFLFADQNLLAPNLSLIAAEFNFNDMERDEKLGGNISFGFFVVSKKCVYIHA